jgi:hypothetical protein
LLPALQLVLKLIGKLQSTGGTSDSPALSDSAEEQMCKAIQAYEDFFMALVSATVPQLATKEKVDSSDLHLRMFDVGCQLLVTLHTHFPSTVRNVVTGFNELRLLMERFLSYQSGLNKLLSVVRLALKVNVKTDCYTGQQSIDVMLSYSCIL